MTAPLSSSDLIALFRKYRDELAAIARPIRRQYFRMARAGDGTTFGDVEGETLYVLVREFRPTLLFEISPNAGYSTNYLLAALTQNAHGMLHSFELETTMRGLPTEQLIRGNQAPEWDQGRLTLHLGDARDTTPKVAGEVDFALIDSCHEAWFAEWYTREIFPRLAGHTVVQDIAFHDRLEPSGEAAFLWPYLQERNAPLVSIGAVERELARLGIREGFAERRPLECNSLLLHFPLTATVEEGTRFQLAGSAEETLSVSRAKLGESPLDEAGRSEIDRLLNVAGSRLLGNAHRNNRHRLASQIAEGFEQLGDADEAARHLQRALAFALQGDLQQRRKALREVAAYARTRQLWRLWLSARLLSILNS